MIFKRRLVGQHADGVIIYLQAVCRRLKNYCPFPVGYHPMQGRRWESVRKGDVGHVQPSDKLSRLRKRSTLRQHPRDQLKGRNIVSFGTHSVIFRTFPKGKPRRRQSLLVDGIIIKYCMLKTGGVMVYSTCTLNTVENEGVILDFLSEHADMEVLPPPENLRTLTREGFGLTHAMRLFPHEFFGEGHFACLLKKTGEEESSKIKESSPFTPLKQEEKGVPRHNRRRQPSVLRHSFPS